MLNDSALDETQPPLDVVEGPLLVHEFLARAAQRTPEAVALIEPKRRATYAELDELANRFANALIGAGVQRGDRVVLALENSIESVACYFGTMRAGAIAVPLAQGPRNDRLQPAVADCAPTTCVVDRASSQQLLTTGIPDSVRAMFVHDRRQLVDRALPAHGQQLLVSDLGPALAQASPEAPRVSQVDLDLAAIIYTSGSTGTPRGVMLTHVNIRANTESIVSYLRLTASDRMMCVLPFYYVYGLSLLHTHVYVGASLVLDNRFAFPNVVLAAMQEHEVTGFAGVPSTFALLLHRSNLTAMSFPHLRYVTQAGGGMAPARILEWLERGPRVPFIVMYGATEAAARLTYLPPEHLRDKLSSIGRAIPNVEMLIVRDDSTIASTGETGELVARGANIAPGYWNDPDETVKRFGPLGYRTGDLGYADTDGFLYLVGRRHDMIKVGAHRVSAKEIEDVLNEIPGVHEAAVIGVSHEILGEAPVAFVVMREGGTGDPDACRVFCHSRLPPHKIPTRLFFRPDLPRTGFGKTDKGALRHLFATLEAEK